MPQDSKATGSAMDIEAVLQSYSRVPFVKRILFPDKSPVAADPSNPRKVMTHKMAYAEADGKFYAYPTVMTDESGALKDYGSAAFDEAMKRRDFIPFSTASEAEQFTKNYKSYWDKIGYDPSKSEARK